MIRFPIFLALGAAVFTGGCAIDPRDYESAPVRVSSPKGVVTCQLYTEERVLWDRAIKVPAGMSIAEGDQVCENEGLRRLNR